MATYFSAEDLLLKQINEKNQLMLTKHDIEFSSPLPAEAVDPNKAKDYNTAVTLKMKRIDQFDGEGTIFYNRLNLSSEFATAGFETKNYLYVERPFSIHGILPHINRKTGLRLTTGNVYDAEISPTDDFTMITVRALPRSMDYTGQFKIGVVNTGVLSSIAPLDPNLFAGIDRKRKAVSGYTPTEANILTRTYGIDYSPIGELLKRVATGLWPTRPTDEPDTLVYYDRLSGLLRCVDGLPWGTTAAPSSLNVWRAYGVYNGPTKDCWIPSDPSGGNSNLFLKPDVRPGEQAYSNPTNTDYTHALVLALNWPYSDTARYRPMAIFHYNLKE